MKVDVVLFMTLKGVAGGVNAGHFLSVIFPLFLEEYRKRLECHEKSVHISDYHPVLRKFHGGKLTLNLNIPTGSAIRLSIIDWL